MSSLYAKRNGFDTTQNNRNNDAEIAKVLALGTDREQTQQLVQDYGQDAYLFNASAATVRNGTAGMAIFLEAETWPALDYRNADISAVVTLLGPCGINQPHTHKFSELQFNVGPGKMGSYFIENNGLSVVNNVKDAGSFTLFPEGSIHGEMNTECVPTTFISAFPNQDAARVDISQLVNFGSDILNATFSGYGTVNLQPLPGADQGAVLRGTEECRKRCGLPDNYNFTDLYPELGYFRKEWFNADVFYSTLSLPGAETRNAFYPAKPAESAPPAPPSTTAANTKTTTWSRRDTTSSDIVAHRNKISIKALPHTMKSYFTMIAIKVTGSTAGVLSLGASGNALGPVVIGLSMINLVLFCAFVFSVLGYGRRRREGEIKF